jgi:hypothetical protein
MYNVWCIMRGVSYAQQSEVLPAAAGAAPRKDISPLDDLTFDLNFDPTTAKQIRELHLARGCLPLSFSLSRCLSVSPSLSLPLSLSLSGSHLLSLFLSLVLSHSLVPRDSFTATHACGSGRGDPCDLPPLSLYISLSFSVSLSFPETHSLAHSLCLFYLSLSCCVSSRSPWGRLVLMMDPPTATRAYVCACPCMCTTDLTTDLGFEGQGRSR